VQTSAANTWLDNKENAHKAIAVLNVCFIKSPIKVQVLFQRLLITT
jgi:hypothetical protein